MTTPLRLTPRLGEQRTGRVPCPEPKLIYAELAVRWASAGRAVPGRPDEKWTNLAPRLPPGPYARHARLSHCTGWPRRVDAGSGRSRRRSGTAPHAMTADFWPGTTLVGDVRPLRRRRLRSSRRVTGGNGRSHSAMGTVPHLSRASARQPAPRRVPEAHSQRRRRRRCDRIGCGPGSSAVAHAWRYGDGCRSRTLAEARWNTRSKRRGRA